MENSIQILCLDDSFNDPIYVTKARKYTDVNHLMRTCLCPSHKCDYEIRVYCLPEDYSPEEYAAFRNLWIESSPSLMRTEELEVRSNHFNTLWEIGESI